MGPLGCTAGRRGAHSMQARLDPATPAGYPRCVPPARSDRTLLLVTGAAVILAAAVFAVVLFFATGGGQAKPKPGPIYIGLESDLHNMVNSGGPLYFAHPFGGTGFWLTVESDHLVALLARRPGTQACTVKWRSSKSAYIDCHGAALASRELDRYQIEFPLGGPEAGGVIVDFHHVDAAPKRLPVR